jgi:cytochrome c551/c552
MKGGSGVWGAIPMPANPQVSEAEAKHPGEVGAVAEIMPAAAKKNAPSTSAFFIWPQRVLT